MKYAAYVALIASVSAGNPNYWVSGPELEKFQRSVNATAHGVKKVIKEDVKPNVESWWDTQYDIEMTYKKAEDQAWAESFDNLDTFDKNLQTTPFEDNLHKIDSDLERALMDIEADFHANGYYHRYATGTQGLWSAGATPAKTAALNEKLLKAAQMAVALGEDPVYGPFIEHHQQILYTEVMVAVEKYESTMEAKYNADPVFKAKVDKLIAADIALGKEIESEDGWTFEDNDGSLAEAASGW